jgi:hypothetical protein
MQWTLEQQALKAREREEKRDIADGKMLAYDAHPDKPGHLLHNKEWNGSTFHPVPLHHGVEVHHTRGDGDE